MLRLAMCSKPRAWESRPDRYFHQLSTCPLAYDQMWKAMERRNSEEPRGPSAVDLLFRRVRLLLQVLRPDTGPGQSLLRFTMHLCLWSCTGPRPSGTHLEPACHGLVGGLEAAAACVCNSIVVSKEFRAFMCNHAAGVPANSYPIYISPAENYSNSPASCDAAAVGGSTAGDSCGASVRHFFATWRSHIRKQCTLDSP